MSYLQFLLLFVGPPIAVLAAAAARRGRLDRRVALSLAAVCGLAVASALPWDGAAIVRGYWFFAADRLIGARIWVVPVEEVAFFVLESVLVGLLLVLLLPGRTPAPQAGRQ